MKAFLVTLLLLLAGEVLAKEPTSCTPKPQGTETNVWWYARRAAKLQEIKDHGDKIQVAFFGDSITHYWEDIGAAVWKKYFCGTPYLAVDLGFGMERTENVLWRMQNGDLDGYAPKAIVIMIGTNNTGLRTEKEEPPCDTVLGIKRILETAREKQPNSLIILCAISPRGQSRNNDLQRRIDTVNREIQKFCDGKTIIFCDWGNQMLDPNGSLPATMCSDYLHPTKKGYEVWAKNLLPLIELACQTNQACACASKFPRYDKTYWMSVGAMRNKIVGTSGQNFGMVFLGDDLLEGFYSVANDIRKEIQGKRTDMNLTLKGDLVQNVHWRADSGELHNYSSRSVIIGCGGANSNDAPAEVALGVESLVATVKRRQGSAKVAVFGLMPCGRDANDPLRKWALSVNEGIKALADGKRVFYIDTEKAVLEEDGSLSEEVSIDGRHLTKEGYRRLGVPLKLWVDSYL